MVKQYELMTLLPANFTSEQVKAFISQIEKAVTARKGTIDSSETLGKRSLAYPIKKQREAYYVLFVVSMDAGVAQAFERDVRLMEDVLRQLFIIYEPKAPSTSLPAESATVEESKE